MLISGIKDKPLRRLAEIRKEIESDELIDAFEWSDTNEGNDFWHQVYIGEIRRLQQVNSQQIRNVNNASYNANEELKRENAERDLRVITFKELNKIILLERKIANEKIEALEKRIQYIEFKLSFDV